MLLVLIDISKDATLIRYFIANKILFQFLGEDIKSFVRHFGSTRLEITGLQLKEGIQYFSNVKAYNKAGLFTTVTSDGFMVIIIKTLWN